MAKIYGYRHEKARRRLLACSPPCYWCGAPATVADHDPPLVSVPPGGVWRGTLRPSCRACSDRQGGSLSGQRKRAARGIPVPSRPW